MSSRKRRWAGVHRALYRAGLKTPATGGGINMRINHPSASDFRKTSRMIRDYYPRWPRDEDLGSPPNTSAFDQNWRKGGLRNAATGVVTCVSDDWFTIIPDDAANPASRRSYSRRITCWSDMGNYVPQKGDRVEVKTYNWIGKPSVRNYVRLIPAEPTSGTYWARLRSYGPTGIRWLPDNDAIGSEGEFAPWSRVDRADAVKHYADHYPDRAARRPMLITRYPDGNFRVQWRDKKEEEPSMCEDLYDYYEKVSLVAAWHYRSPEPRFELWRVTPAEKNGRTLRLYDQGVPAKGGQWHYDEAGARRRADYILACESNREMQCLVEQVQTLEGQVNRLRRVLGCDITVSDESHTLKQKDDKTMNTEDRCGTSIPQSDTERVRFRLAPRYYGENLGARRNSCERKVMVGIISDAMSVPLALVERMMKANSDGFDIICTPAQFGRFIVLRHDRYKGTNGIKDLSPEMFDVETRECDVLDVTKTR